MRVFFICPKCKKKVYEYVNRTGDGVNTWTFSCQCRCGNNFINNCRLGDPNKEFKDALKPENMAKLVKETMGYL